jgi:hypothetical protein
MPKANRPIRRNGSRRMRSGAAAGGSRRHTTHRASTRFTPDIAICQAKKASTVADTSQRISTPPTARSVATAELTPFSSTWRCNPMRQPW